MGIDTGLAITCADLQATGGIKRILIRAWTDTDIVAYGAAGAHTITSILSAATTEADWGVYEFKNETPALTISATKEMGSTAFECGLSFFLPKLEYNKFNLIESITNSCLMVIAVDTNDTAFVLGASEKYQNEATGKQSRSQTYAQLSSIEGASGAAYSDESGVTISLTARQFEMPRQYIVPLPSSTTGIIVAATGLTATTD
tara:strand:- start:156 stop:761 length:606 start_codon:yes stop_codon:yes gene_type:complete